MKHMAILVPIVACMAGLALDHGKPQHDVPVLAAVAAPTSPGVVKAQRALPAVADAAAWAAGPKAAILAQAAAPAPAPVETAGLPGGATSLQENYQDWQVKCEVQGTAKRCAVSQQQVDAQTHQRALAVELRPVVEEKVDGVFLLPFGLSLEPGITLQVDEAEPAASLRFRTCLPAGCVVPAGFDAALLAALRKGAALKIKAVADGAGPLTFTVSLKGLANALDRATVLSR